MFESAVDGFGRAVGCAGAVESASAARFFRVRPRVTSSVRAAGTPRLTELVRAVISCLP